MVQLTDNEGHWTLARQGSFPGKAYRQWAFKSYGDHLAVATTTGQAWGIGDQQQSNNLFILQPENDRMSILSSITHFGLNENIRSVRYINSKAYVVTFRQVDPLFVIDLENIEHPRILDELKAPGFSTYMHPVDADTLLGFGQSADQNGMVTGFQLSLFDISDDYNLKTSDQFEFGNRFSFSDALHDHTSLYINTDERILGFPVIHDEIDFLWENLMVTPVFTGAEFYTFADNEIRLVGAVSHSDWLMETCNPTTHDTHYYFYRHRSFDVNRVFEVNSRLFSLSRYGIKEHDIEDLDNVLISQKFTHNDSDCPGHY
ncbi:MAG: beta-propeller domain-containing protein [Bdellovibrionales bacterium]|nr:beta-propeller domain-containing protein [Bdellovibrionales bacterium]